MGFLSHLVLTQPLFRKTYSEANILSLSYQPDSGLICQSETHWVFCQQPSSQAAPGNTNPHPGWIWQMLFAVTCYSVCFCLCWQRFWAWGRGHPGTPLPFSPALLPDTSRWSWVHHRAVLDPALWSLLWYNPIAPAQLLPPDTKESSVTWLGDHNRAPEARSRVLRAGRAVWLSCSLNQEAVSSTAFPHMHIFLPYFKTNSLTLRTSVYHIDNCFEVRLFQSNLAGKGLPSQRQAVRPCPGESKP